MACVRVQLGIVGLFIVLCGCGRNGISGSIRDATVGDSDSQSTGGTSPGTGGATPSGGFASGGTTSASGGSATVSTGGTSSSPTTGGTTGQTGGGAATASIGGAGGSSTTGGATGPEGGTSQSAGTGGTSLSGSAGTASGGRTSAIGGASTASTGGAGGSSTTGGATGQGGAGLAEFCAGSTKVAYQGKILTPAVTSYNPLGMLNCCMSYGVRLHTSKDIGKDLQVIVDVAVGPDVSGTYEIGASQWAVRAGLHLPSEDTDARHSVVGSIEIKGSYTDPAPWQMGLCLEVTDTATDLYGTRVYVPSVNVLGFTLPSPLDFFLLQDSTLTVDKAALVPLATLPLAPTAFLRLDQIDFVEKASHWIGVVPEYGTVESLQKTLGHVPLYGTPFVIKVEGQALFLGAFMSLISSVGYRVPTVWVDEMVTDGFPLRAGPLVGSTDALADPSVVKVLTDAGRWVP